MYVYIVTASTSNTVHRSVTRNIMNISIMIIIASVASFLIRDLFS